ncbi:amino acid permease [Staphylospora marina]|uniref:amino acid permease n=1 Tax=Staphylospora marina TaxID=2490858 RepID=UPI000F5BFA11|nr:amino acid permease [Staphylospora marina]
MQPLAKTIRLPQAIALYIGAVMGSGILAVPGLAAEMAGPASLFAWGVMLVLMLPMALVMGWLSTRHPHAGGVSHFVRLTFGERAGACVGWFFLISVAIGSPVNALIGAGYLSTSLGLGEGVRILLAAVLLGITLLIHWRGMHLGGNVQILIVTAIIAVLLMVIVGSAPHIESAHFTPVAPNGWMAVGQSATILFWCFIGWEAVSHLSGEFVDPRRDMIKSIVIASVIVGLLYFLTALATVGTASYGGGMSDASLVHVIDRIFGTGGKIVTGITGFLICTGTSITYGGAGARLAYALAESGAAPKRLATLSGRQTPVGGILFLAACFFVILSLYATGMIPLKILLLLPNASFLLTYLIGCAAGIRLLKDDPVGRKMSWISLIATGALLPFTGWSMLFPATIAVMVWVWTGRRRNITVSQ